jgi:tetratricopeptide (TPR) repeat protein
LDNREILPPGTVLDGSYRIKGVVGSGGFGITYEADEINLGTVVAVKEYYPLDFGERAGTMSVRPKSDRHVRTFDWGRSSFIREARTLARFDHPSIVNVSRVFEANSTAYMVMRFERGRSFEAWLRELGRLPTQEELDRIVAPLLEALQTLHAADFLHRDIAPDNIIVRADGTPVLLDFGAARRAVAEMSQVFTGIVKAGYSPHEQYSSDGRLQGPWSDLYALGGTLYRAVSGHPPEEATMRFDEDRMPPAVEVGRGHYRPGFLAAIDMCLRVRHSQRPRSVAQLRPMLLEGEEQKVPSLSRIVDALKAPKISQLRPPPTVAHTASRAAAGLARHWPTILGGLLAILGGLYGGYYYTRMQPTEPSAGDAERRAKETQELARRQAEQETERKRKDAEAAASRKAATNAERRRKEEETAKQDAEKRRKDADEAAKRQASVDAENRRKADLARKKADDDAAARSKTAQGHLEQGRSYASSGDHTRAIAELDEAIRLDPKLVAAYWQRGIAYANKGDHTRAIADYEQALVLDPQSTDAYYGRGFSNAMKGDYDRAIADFDEAIRLNPKLAGAYWQRGVAYTKKGDQTRAIADYDEAIRLDPKLARAYLNRGNAYEFLDDYDRAIADYDEAIRLQPQLSDAYYARGFSYWMKGDFARAVTDYDEAIRLNPKAAAVYWRRGSVYAMRGDYTRAIADYDEAIRLNPQFAAAYWQRGVSYANKGEPARAINDYNDAIRLDPNLARAYWDRGNAFATRGDHARAIEDFDRAIRLEPKLAGAYYSRGVSYARRGNRARALEDFRKTLELDPNHAQARRELQSSTAR